MKRRKIIPAILAGVALFSINSNVKATDSLEFEDIKQVISDDGKQINIEYRPKSFNSSGTRFLSNVFSRIAENNVGVSLPNSYIPTFKRDLKVKNQLDSSECWANAFASACEAYNYANGLANSGEEYSARHINYSCSSVFLDKTINTNVFNRDAKETYGGNFYMAMTYAMNRQGPVLESDMPSSENVSYINYDELNTKNGTKLDIKDYLYFPSIYKNYLTDGTVEYYNSFDYSDKQYKDKIDDVQIIRNTIKQQIKENGAVMATIYQFAEDKDVYMQPIEDENQAVSANHAVCIIGWDDEYMPEKDDFIYRGMTEWKNKGAYIALNSYGDEFQYGGFTYISYDDFYVEQNVVGIKNADIAKDDNAYVHDELGCNYSITRDTKTLSVVNVFNRNSSGEEILNGISIPSYVSEKANVYYTENFNTNGLPLNFKLLKENIDVGIGGTYLDIDDLKLTKSKFAICVTYISTTSNPAAIAIEKKVTQDDSIYKYVTCESGESYIVDTNNVDGSFDCNATEYTYHNINFNGNMVNAGIKAYTSNVKDTPDPTPTPSESVTPTPSVSPSPSESPTPSVSPNPSESPTPSPEPTNKITSTKYKINNNLITRVPVNTTMEEFKNNITVDGEYQIVDKNDKTVATTLVRTGYKVKIGNEVYTISVVSDISGSGADKYARVIDIAKMRAHIVEYKGSILTGAQLDAADINGNGYVDVIDLAKMRQLCVE